MKKKKNSVTDEFSEESAGTARSVEPMSEDDRRTKRRKRRRRAQAVSYLIVGIFAVAVVGGLVVGVRRVSDIILDGKARAIALTAQSGDSSSEEITILSPEGDSVPSSAALDDALESRITGTLQNMTLEEKAAGLFLITPEQLTGVDSAVKAGSGTQTALEQYAIGGLVYSSNNIQDADQIRNMLATTSEMSKYPAFLAVSEEGGAASIVAQRLSLGGTAALSQLAGTDDASANGDAMGRYLIDTGFNMNLAPSANLSEADNSFGTDPQLAAQKASAYVSAMEAAGMSSCMKSFPVEGDDNGSELVVSELSAEELQAGAFLPFKAGIDAGVDCIMMSNTACPSITGVDYLPCSLAAPAITDILRGTLGFEGVVITAPLNTPYITSKIGSAETAVAAIQAGADILYLPDNFQEAYNGILEAVNNGILTEERLDESLRRILRVKYSRENI